MQLLKKTYVPILLIICLATVVCCSPKSGNSILTFLFDGAPESTQSLNEETLDSLDQEDNLSNSEDGLLVESSYVYHNPYLKKLCDICHDKASLGELTMPQPALCYQCHLDYSEEFSFVHGPVAAGYCTSCHDPHMAESETFLKRTGQPLCLHCHNAELVYKNEIHEGIEEYACTECHNPHGGETWYYY